MSVVRHKVKSCCRTLSFTFETNKPIKKHHLDIFKKAGYICPPNFASAGIFYVRGNGIIAQSSFGATKINVKCSGSNCTAILNQFEQLLDKTINSN